jgi:hypothetical protein
VHKTGERFEERATFQNVGRWLLVGIGIDLATQQVSCVLNARSVSLFARKCKAHRLGHHQKVRKRPKVGQV